MNKWRNIMNTRYDNHAPFAHGHRSHPVTLLNAAVASADNAFIDALELREDIQVRAFHKWEAAGKPAGNGVHFWLEAERELAEGKTENSGGRDKRPHDHSLEAKAAEENARALDASVDSHYRDNNRMFQRHGDRGHRHGVKND
jgi:hypothetical protein